MFAVTGAIVVNQTAGGAVTQVSFSLTFGLVVMAMIDALGDVPGAHLNPAVSVGFVLARRFPARGLPRQVFAQVVGAFGTRSNGPCRSLAGTGKDEASAVRLGAELQLDGPGPQGASHEAPRDTTEFHRAFPMTRPLSSEAAALHVRQRAAAERGGGIRRQAYAFFGTWYYGWRHSAEVSRQLRARSPQSRDLWAATGYDRHVADQVCAAIQAVCGWPNPWFIPDDPLDVVIDSPFDALAIVDFLFECEERLGVELAPGALHHAATVGDAVRVMGEAVAAAKIA